MVLSDLLGSKESSQQLVKLRPGEKSCIMVGIRMCRRIRAGLAMKQPEVVV